MRPLVIIMRVKKITECNSVTGKDDDDEEEDYGGRKRDIKGEEEEEEVMLEIRRPVNPSSHGIVNYLGMGKTEAARRKRRE
jgi:hypothetical protein